MTSIRSQFTLIFCLLAILPLAVFGLFAYGMEAHHLRQDYEAKLLALHENKALLLESWLKERLGDARYGADSPLVSGLLKNPSPDLLAAVRQRLALFAQNAVAYERVFVVSAANGQVVASTQPSDEGRPPGRGLGGLLQGGQNIYISDAFCSGEPCQPHIDLGVPVVGPGARTLGALLIEIDLNEALGRTVLSRRGLGETGEAVLVNPKLLALSEPRYRPGEAFRLRVTSQPASLTIRRGVSLIQSSDYRAVPVVAAYRKIHPVTWGLMVKQDEAELELPITMLRWLLLAVVGGSVAVASAAAAWLAGWLTRPLEALARAIRRLSQGERGVRVEARGPSELASTARAFNAMARELHALEIFRERFASAAGHDLKGNLVPLAGLLKLLASGRAGQLTDKQRELLETCQRSTERQMSLADRLIEAVRLHAGEVALEWRDVSVAEVLAESAALFRPLAEEAGVALRLEAEDVVVRADRERLSRIIQNLLANAIRYNRRGGMVRMAACAHEGRVEIEVADTGRGIAPEEQPALFEPFSRLGKFKDGGLGLGLWIVKTLVELHGWTINVESQSGKGSSFRILTAASS